jgi:uncharacterized protein
VKRKAVATPKFFFFDVGIANQLLKRGEVKKGSDSYGNVLEHLLFLELRTSLDYRRSQKELTYWRSRSQLEVDFVVGNEIGIEVKATGRVSKRDERGLNALAEEIPTLRKIIVCH